LQQRLRAAALGGRRQYGRAGDGVSFRRH
jgi:hypothetical protein